jgi:hypothetical protein
MKIKFITTGGTIDKVYFDARSEYEVLAGAPAIYRKAAVNAPQSKRFARFEDAGQTRQRLDCVWL